MKDGRPSEGGTEEALKKRTQFILFLSTNFFNNQKLKLFSIMKKQVLLALMALFSFVGAWASVDVNVGAYTVTLSDNVALLADGVAEAPTVSSVKKGETSYDVTATAVYDANSASLVAVDEEEGITEIGNYYLGVSFTENEATKTIYVPFKVGTTEGITTELIWNKATWDASVESGILSGYFTLFPWYDLWNAEEERVGNFNEASYKQLSYDDAQKWTHDWKAIAKDTEWRAKMFPQINFKVTGQAEGAEFYPMADYRDADGNTQRTYLETNKLTGAYEKYGNGNFWMISIPQLYNNHYPSYSVGDNVNNLPEAYQLTYASDGTPVRYNYTNTAASSVTQALSSGFQESWVKLFLVPAEDATAQYVWYLTDESVVYTGEEINLAQYVKVINLATGEELTDGYTVGLIDATSGDANYDDDATGTNAGEYALVVKISGDQEDDEEGIELDSKDFTIEPKDISVPEEGDDEFTVALTPEEGSTEAPTFTYNGSEQ